MGLDMYLWAGPEDQYDEAALERGEIKKSDGLVEIAYWRKANAIHKWFVDTCQDGIDECQLTVVHPEQLLELRELCRQITDDPFRASELLPTESGFFFGGTDYDEWYFENLLLTVKQLEDNFLGNRHARGKTIYYRSSW